MDIDELESLSEYELENLLDHLGVLENKLKYESNYYDFFKESWDVLEPGVTYEDEWYVQLVCEYVQFIIETPGPHRFIFNMPPRFLKSRGFTVVAPVWSWTKESYLKWIMSSYSNGLSVGLSMARRELIKSEWYQSMWGHRFKIKPNHDTNAGFSNDKQGHQIATSVSSTITGWGCDILVNDDPHNPKQADSDVQRKEAITHHERTLFSRHNDKRNPKEIIVMQRLHEKDLTGHLIEKGQHTIIDLPAEFKKRRVYSLPISKEKRVYKRGSYLSSRMQKEECKETLKAMGSYAYAGQYLQMPTPADGGIIKDHWWRYYAILPGRFDEVCISLDCTFKDLETSDYVVFQVWGRWGADYYLIEQVRMKLDFPETLKIAISLAKKYKNFYKFYIEDKANGTAVISMLKKVVSRVKEINPEGNKISRLRAVSPVVESGNVYIPDPHTNPWVKEFITEFNKFPKGDHDDQVDSFSQCVVQMRQREGNSLRDLLGDF